MNNKEQLQKQAQKLQEELDKLKEQIEACDEEELEPDRVKKGESYWYVSSQGLVCTTQERDYISDDSRYISGNYFKTKEEAIKYADIKRTKVRLQRLAKKLNKGREIDWTNNLQNKYYIGYDFSLDCLTLHWASTAKSSRVYCLSSRFLDEAVAEIDKRYLKDYLKSEV